MRQFTHCIVPFVEKLQMMKRWVITVALIALSQHSHGALEPLKSLHDGTAEARSSFAPTSSSVAAAQSRTGQQLVFAQPRDSYSGGSSSGGYSTVGATGGSASSSAYGAPSSSVGGGSSSAGGSYGAPVGGVSGQNPQGSMTYYYYHYPAAAAAAANGGAGGGWGGDVQGA
jgi:hypothetical protein